MKYKGIKSKGRTAVNVLAVVIAIAMFYMEVKYRLWLYLPLNALVLLVCFVDRDKIIDEKGVAIRYRLFKRVISIKYWMWAEITNLTTDYQHSSSNIALNFQRGDHMRTVIMNPGEGWGAIRFAQDMNPALNEDMPKHMDSGTVQFHDVDIKQKKPYKKK